MQFDLGEFVRDPFWQFIFGVITVTPICFGAFKAFQQWRKRKPRAIKLSINGVVDYRLLIAVMNNSNVTLYNIKLKSEIRNRFKGWRFWQSTWIWFPHMVPISWDSVSPQKSVITDLNLMDVHEVLIETGQTQKWNTHEKTPPLFDLVFPEPITMRFALTYNADLQHLHTHKWELKLICRFPTSLTGERNKFCWKIQEIL